MRTASLLLPATIAILLSGANRASAENKSSPVNDDQRKLLKVFVAEFVDITPGKGDFPKSFLMGATEGPNNERPAHEVTFRYSFAIARYEVPQNLYEAVTGSNPSRWTGPRNSVEMFDIRETLEFCSKLTAMLRAEKLIKADEEIRLPTEAEWEYCCRAGTTTRYSFGDKAQAGDDKGKLASLLDPYGWHTGNAAGNDPPVGALKPNAWGLYDMHGYLWEFVSDRWYEDYTDAPSDGSARKSDNAKTGYVVRGGSWREEFPQLTSTARRAVSVDFKRDDLGFRCVKATVSK